MLDTVTPVKISVFANLFNAVLDPILIFSFAMGVPGAAVATLAAEVISAVTYLSLMRRRQMIRFRKIFSIPSWEKLEPLIKGGAALQLRNFALNLTFLAVTRVTQSIDNTGVAAAAHALAIQTFQVGGIVLLALSTVAQIVVPGELVEKYDEETGRTVGGSYAAKAVVKRLMSWSLLMGIVLAGFQLAVLPALHMATPMMEVRETARIPSYLASLYQVFNGMVFVGEGVMIGCGNYMQLSMSTVVATAGCLWALKILPGKYGLAGVWLGFGVFNGLRLLGVILHQTTTGPLAKRNLRKALKSAEKKG
jgi:Na+-driven multidrug efflux pump